MLSVPAAAFDRLSVAVTTVLSTSLMTMSTRFNAVFWV